jgi:hypothetical protein
MLETGIAARLALFESRVYIRLPSIKTNTLEDDAAPRKEIKEAFMPNP